MANTMRSAVFMAALWLGAPGAAGAQDMCADPQARCAAGIDPNCAETRLGAGALTAAPAGQVASCRAQMAAYRQCLTEVAEQCGGTAGSAAPAASTGGGGACPPALEERLWNTVRESNDPDELRIYIDRCPDSPFAAIAKRRIAAAEQPAKAAKTVRPPAAQRPARAATPAPVAQQGYRGQYYGTWRSPAFGTSGRSEFQVRRFDPASGALEGVMGIEYGGVMYQGVVRGRLTPGSGGQASGRITANGVGWTTTLSYDPTSDYTVITGSFSSVPLPGTYGATVPGVFRTQLAR